MQLEKVISLDSKKILAQVCFEVENKRIALHPCSGEGFSDNLHIECFQDLTNFVLGDLIEIEVIEMLTANGNAYLYSFN